MIVRSGPDVWYKHATPAQSEESDLLEGGGDEAEFYSPARIPSGSEMEDSEDGNSKEWDQDLRFASFSQRVGAAHGPLAPCKLDLLSTPESPQQQWNPWTPRAEGGLPRPTFEPTGQGITFVHIDPDSGEFTACNPYGEPKPQDTSGPSLQVQGYSSLVDDGSDSPRVEVQAQHPFRSSSPSPDPARLTSLNSECRGCKGKHVAHTCGKGRSGSLLAGLGKRTSSEVFDVKTPHKRSVPSPHRKMRPSFAENGMDASDDDDDDDEWVVSRRPHKRSAALLAVNRTLPAPPSLEGKVGSGSGLIHLKITEPKPENKCSYELCYNPYHTSGGWKWVTKETKAGNRDWTPYIGRLFCNACFTQYATTGSISRKGRVKVRPQLQDAMEQRQQKGRDERRHAGGMSLRKALQHKTNF